MTPHGPSGAGPGLGEETYERILTRLVSLQILPGDRLTVDALARDLGVSQTPVREALSRLESDGLVVKTHLRGFRAAPTMTRKEFESLYEFRLLIEPAAAGDAALARSADELETMLKLEHQMQERGSSWSSYGEFASLDAELHGAIALASQNRLIYETMNRLHTHLHIFRLIQDQRVTLEAVDEHRALVEAIERGDGLVAEAAMRSHIERSRSRIIRAFD